MACCLIGANDGILLIWPLGANFSEILIWIQTLSFNKMHLEVSSAKWYPFCLDFNALINWTHWILGMHTYISVQGHHIAQVMAWCCIGTNHYLYQCLLLVNWTLRNELYWNFYPKFHQNIFPQKQLKCCLQNVPYFAQASMHFIAINMIT